MKNLKKTWFWIGLIIFVFFIAHLGYSYKDRPPKSKSVEESNTCLCRGDLDHNGVINRRDLKLMLKIIRGEITPIPPYECGDLNYNLIPYEIADYVFLSNWVSQHHAIQCKKQKPALISLIISEIDARPCEMITVPIFIQNDITIGAFDLWIEFDCTLLYPRGVDRGEVLTYKDSTGNYLWEFFTYRQLPNPNSLMYHLEIFGLYDIKDKRQGIPLQPSPDSMELAKIKFQVACDDNLKGSRIPIDFLWDSDQCTENTMSDTTGFLFFVSNDTSQFNPRDCNSYPYIIPSLHFENGEVNILKLPEEQIGDIDLNGVPFEIGDATLIAEYFMYGIEVFTIDIVKQIGNSDIDDDGTPLTLTDFLLLIRIMQGKTYQGNAFGTSDKVVYFTQSKKDSTILISLSSEIPIGAALFIFNCSGIPGIPFIVSTDMDIMYKSGNGEIRVLVYSFEKGVNIPAGSVDLLAVPLNRVVKLQSIYMVDNRGRDLKVIQAPAGVSNKSFKRSPQDFVLLPNYPNPFNPDTYIEYALPSDCQVTLVVYNILGQKVRTLVNEYQPAGFKSVRWDGKDDSGNLVSAGVYFYSIKAGEFSQTKKMILLK